MQRIFLGVGVALPRPTFSFLRFRIGGFLADAVCQTHAWVNRPWVAWMPARIEMQHQNVSPARGHVRSVTPQHAPFTFVARKFAITLAAKRSGANNIGPKC